MLFDRIRISHRIYAGFLVLVLMLLGLSALSSWYLLGFAGDADRIAKRTELVGLANDYALKLERLSNQVLLYAQTVDPEVRSEIATIQDNAISSREDLTRALIAIGDDDKANDLKVLAEKYIATLEPLVLRAENMTASADTILLGANQMGGSSSDLVSFINKRDPEIAEKYGDRLSKDNLSAIVSNLEYAIVHTPAALETARNATSSLTDLHEEIKTAMGSLKRADKKLFSYATRDNDLLKQGANQLEGSFSGFSQSMNDFKAAVREVQKITGQIRAEAIAGQNELVEAVHGKSESSAMTNMVVAMVGALIAILLAAGTATSILRPLRRVNGDMTRLATNDTNIDLADIARRDEFGVMARTVSIFRDNALKIETMAEDRIELQRQEEEKRRASLGGMAETIEGETSGLVESVSRQVNRMRDAVNEVSAAADRVNGQTEAATSAADQSREHAQSISDAATRLSGAIGSIAGRVDRQRTIAQSAVDSTRESAAAVDDLRTVASSIEQMVDLIRGIAAQTNMLAMNATIEAARAGEAGRGFAVVAAEVKNLAGQTAEATEQITTHVGAMGNVTDRCVAAMENVGVTVRDMMAISDEVAGDVKQQRRETEEISIAIRAASDAAKNVGDAILEVSRDIDHTRSLSLDLTGHAEDVTAHVSELTLSLNRAVRDAAEKDDGDGKDPRVMAGRDIRVTFHGQGKMTQTSLYDLSIGGISVTPSQDWERGRKMVVEIAGLKGRYNVEVMSRRGLDAPKMRLKFIDPLEQRGDLVMFVARMWQKHLTDANVIVDDADRLRAEVANDLYADSRLIAG
ncbi:methyl-accepting chemotaxis protein [Thalassospira sp. MCCC 1A01428]|uniref:methyl-accepting chemotaxis protein n=1 Tax=Thalassospira sp. MCCC 1A01428 TaxID=1470575 RepID=UPI000A1F2022|nr:methyl-accepting chemotaxis protein [Thalassospira sp. MCCC 1A01428]